jgi:aminoglycoside phosphotransferase (APT) family kinase protein
VQSGVIALQRHVDTLKPGNVFRDWLVHRVEDRLHNERCKVRVYKIPASHTVCRYEFAGENYSVVAKFYAEPTGRNRSYNAEKAMDREFEKLQRVEGIVDISRPIAKKKKFNCALVTEYVDGNPLNRYIKTERDLYDRLTAVAELLRRLHDNTATEYRKDREFARFHRVLDQMGLYGHTREKYNRLLGEWWYSSRLDRNRGCMIHNDAHPANYVFNHDRVYALDFESAWEQAHPVHDLGIVAAELKKYFGWNQMRAERAEPYIGHFLWHYARGENEFHEITRALPFFMAMGLLRMARWKGESGEKDFVLREARACLRAAR